MLPICCDIILTGEKEGSEKNPAPLKHSVEVYKCLICPVLLCCSLVLGFSFVFGKILMVNEVSLREQQENVCLSVVSLAEQ